VLCSNIQEWLKQDWSKSIWGGVSVKLQTLDSMIFSIAHAPFMLLTDFTPLGELQAQMALNDLDGALESLTNASQLEPNDGTQMVTSKTSMPWYMHKSLAPDWPSTLNPIQQKIVLCPKTKAMSSHVKMFMGRLYKEALIFLCGFCSGNQERACSCQKEGKLFFLLLMRSL